MKIKLMFKTPDVAHDIMQTVPLDDKAIVEKAIAKFVRYNEYLDVVIDTEAGTATVLEQKQ